MTPDGKNSWGWIADVVNNPERLQSEPDDLRARIAHLQQMRVITLDDRTLKAIETLIAEAEARLRELEGGN
jgi:hypothetical protein